MMPNRLFIVPDVEHAMWNIGVNLCSLVLRPKGSMVLQGSHIINAPGILWSTPPVRIRGGRHWKARSLVWNLLFLLWGGQEVVWSWLLLTKRHSWALSLTASSVVSSLSLICLVSLQSSCNSLAFRTSILLRLLLNLDTYVVKIIIIVIFFCCCIRSSSCMTDLSIYFQPNRRTTIWMFFFILATISLSLVHSTMRQTTESVKWRSVVDTAVWDFLYWDARLARDSNPSHTGFEHDLHVPQVRALPLTPSWRLNLGEFPLFLKKVADIIAPKLSITFRKLIYLGSFSECWRSANVTAMPKGAPFPDKENYRPISITSHSF